MHPSIHLYSETAREFIGLDFEVRILAEDHQFTEGPVWNGEGFYLYSDIPANRVYRVEEGGQRSVFLEESGTSNPSDPLINADEPGSNGLAYNGEGQLLLCRHGDHSVGRLVDGRIETIAGFFHGRPFNSPNDLVALENKVYFTDPPYGLKGKVHNPEVFQPLAGVYCLEEERISLL